MNKTISITLAGIIFHIEEDAYKKLKEYLDAIRDHFIKADGGDEIMDDIEASIAEKFSKSVSKNKQVVSKDEVEELVKIMGSVEDYKESDLVGSSGVHEKEDEDGGHKSDQGSDEDEGDNYRVAKKLYRDVDDVVFAGVCSGLAAYFGVDPVFVRLLFVVTIFFGGAGFVAYIVLWIAMPEAKTSTQKLEMRGKTVTIKKIEKVIKEKVEPQVKKSTPALKKILSVPFNFLAAVFRGFKKFFFILGPIIRIFIGLVILLTGFGLMFPLLFASAVLIFNIDSPYLNSDIPISDIINGIPYTLGVVSATLIVLVPLLFIFLLGILIISKKKVFNVYLSTVLLVTWMLSIVTFGVVAIDAAPEIERKVKEIKETEMVSKTLNLEEFNTVQIEVPYEVHIASGTEYQVDILAREKSLEKIIVTNDMGALKIDRANFEEGGICLFCHNWPIQIEIQVPEIKELKASDYSKVYLNDFKASEIKLFIDKGAKVYLNSEFETVKAELKSYSRLEHNVPYFKEQKVMQLLSVLLDGNSRFVGQNLKVEKAQIDLDDYSRVDLSGEIKEMSSKLQYYSRVDAFEAETKSAKLSLDNYSKAQVNVKSDLEVEANKYSSLVYKGEPDLKEKTSSYAKVKRYDGDSIEINIIDNNERVEFHFVD